MKGRCVAHGNKLLCEQLGKLVSAAWGSQPIAMLRHEAIRFQIPQTRSVNNCKWQTLHSAPRDQVSYDWNSSKAICAPQGICTLREQHRFPCSSLDLSETEKGMQTSTSKRPPNLTVQNLSLAAAEDSLFSHGVDTPGHKPPQSFREDTKVHQVCACCLLRFMLSMYRTAL